MSEHTPGPWEWWTSNSWRRLRHSDRGVSTDVIMPVVCPDGHPDLNVNDADASLIAAAPELLAALQVLADEAQGFNVSGVYFNEECMGHKGLKMAWDAIAKATKP